MSDPLRRGDVVACRRAVGVVWDVRPDALVILPIGKSDGQTRRHEIPITEIADLIAAGLSSKRPVIHADMPETVPLDGQTRLGQLPGHLQCQVSRAVMLATTEAHFRARWDGERQRRMGRLAGLRNAV